MLYFLSLSILHTYTPFFLGQLHAVYSIHAPHSLLSRLLSLQQAPSSLPGRSLARPHLYHLISFHIPIDYTRFPGQFYITILIHAFLDNCILQYTHLAVWAGNTGWICHCNAWMNDPEYYMEGAKAVVLGYWIIDLSGCKHRYRNRPSIWAVDHPRNIWHTIEIKATHTQNLPLAP